MENSRNSRTGFCCFLFIPRKSSLSVLFLKLLFFSSKIIHVLTKKKDKDVDIIKRKTSSDTYQ